MSDTSLPPVLLLGAGRQGGNALDVALAMGRTVVGFLDDTQTPGSLVRGLPVLGGFALIEEPDTAPEAELFVAVGANAARRAVSRRVLEAGRSLANLIHPTTLISPTTTVGRGVYMSVYCVIRGDTHIGDGLLLEGHSGIGARVHIGDYVGTGPNIQITADVRVGVESFLGASVTVTNRAHVGSRTVIGAGATVLHDIGDNAFAVGTPARIVDARNPPDPHRPR